MGNSPENLNDNNLFIQVSSAGAKAGNYAKIIINDKPVKMEQNS